MRNRPRKAGRQSVPAQDPTFHSEMDRARVANHRHGKVRQDPRSSHKYEPGHPRDANGYVKYPTQFAVEMTDMREAQRSYEANLNVIGATRRMIQKTMICCAPEHA